MEFTQVVSDAESSPNRPRLSVVVPIFNEEECLDELINRLRSLMDDERMNIDFHVILVDDGSSDRSVEIVNRETNGDSRFQLIVLTRNFGHQVAVTAGLDCVQTEYVAIIDADLQDPPELLPEMLVTLISEKVHIVYGLRKSRDGESIFKTLTAKIFYRFLRRLSGIDIPIDVGDFRVMDKTALAAVKRFQERNRFLRGLLPWTGLSSKPFPYDRRERFAGSTKYGMRQMIHFAGDAVTAFSATPLRVIQILGVVVSVGAIAMLGLIVAVYGLSIPVSVFTIWLSSMLSGLNLTAIGVVAGYVHRIQDEVRGRPLYFHAELDDSSRTRSV